MKKLIWCECVADLCDGYNRLDTWADIWVDDHGELYISFSAGWPYYNDAAGLPWDYFLVRGQAVENLVRWWFQEDGGHIPPLELFDGDFVAASEFEQIVDYSMFDAEWR